MLESAALCTFRDPKTFENIVLCTFRAPRTLDNAQVNARMRKPNRVNVEQVNVGRISSEPLTFEIPKLPERLHFGIKATSEKSIDR